MTVIVKTRFAPSPTGLMHFGNLRTALFNYLYAKRFCGIFLLRIEDTDAVRSKTQYRDDILADLHWLGIEWQEGPYHQSERQAIYHDCYEKLERMGLAYPCFCTEEQLATTRKIQLSSGKPPRYPGTCRHLPAEDILKRKTANVPFTLRFTVPHAKTVTFKDLIKGVQTFNTSHIGDFIIRRNDGSASFMFCNAIDDALMGVTHALRGDDHLTNTPRQVLILQALGLSEPLYGHFPTILGPDSRRLSKRNGSRSIQALRAEGFLPLAILNYLARLGHTLAAKTSDLNLLDLEALSEHFNLEHISHAPAHYDSAQLHYWQKSAMRMMSRSECWQQLLPVVGSWVPQSQIDDFIEAVQPNLVMPADALPFAQAIYENALTLGEEALKVIQGAGPEFFEIALNLLQDPDIPLSEWLRHLQEKTGRKGKAFFFPLRAALTADLHGPELVKVLSLMGIEKAKTRLGLARQYAKNL